jgi:hypothetical protein
VVAKPHGKISLGRYRLIRKENTQMNLIDKGFEGVK